MNSRTTGSVSKLVGRTMYFVFQSSDIFCRIYNKALEIKCKTGDDEAEVPKDWTRLEIIYKSQRANTVAEHIIINAKVGYFVKATLNNYLRFMKTNGDANRSSMDDISGVEIVR